MIIRLGCLLAALWVWIVPVNGLGMEPSGGTAGFLEKNIDAGSVLGAGVMRAESPYRGADASVYPIPILVFEAKKVFVDSTVFGCYFNDAADPLRWAVIGSARLEGYDADDSDDLAGMKDRDWALDGGVRAVWKNNIADMIFEAVTDLSGTHRGQELRLAVSRRLFEGFLTPRAGIRWQSGKLVDYYYGVNPEEARAGRPEYSPGSDIGYMAGVTVGVPLGQVWAAFGDIECSFLGDQAGDSPIVGRDAILRYVAGVVYRF